jgi:hypothetical protein
VAFGTVAVWIARDYPFGTSFKMGPGYFPTVLGALLAGVGLLIVFRGLFRSGTAVGAFAYRQLILVLVSTLLFGLLLRGAGLVVAVLLVVAVSAHASIKFRWGPTAAIATGMAAFCVLVFVKALGMPIPVLGPWFGL